MVKGLRWIVKNEEFQKTFMRFDSEESFQDFCEKFVFNYLEPMFGTEKSKKFPLDYGRANNKIYLIVPNDFFYFVKDYINQQN